MAHVGICTFPFELARQDISTLLPQVVSSLIPRFENLVIQSYPYL